jgi:(2Fe-2S) ferredoxin
MWNYTPVILFSVQDSFPVKKKKHNRKCVRNCQKKRKLTRYNSANIYKNMVAERATSPPKILHSAFSKLTKNNPAVNSLSSW